MVERTKRAIKGINSLEKEIQKHLAKIKSDVQGGNIDRGKYHCKEVDKSLITALEIKLKIAGIPDKSIIQKYRKKLDELKDILSKNL